MKQKEPLHPLVSAILTEAKRKGMTQKAVAEKAEMAPESLSRIIRTGNMELKTLERLMQAVGLGIQVQRHETTSS